MYLEEWRLVYSLQTIQDFRFCIGITLAIFNFLGTMPVTNGLLKMCAVSHLRCYFPERNNGADNNHLCSLLLISYNYTAKKARRQEQMKCG